MLSMSSKSPGKQKSRSPILYFTIFFHQLLLFIFCLFVLALDLATDERMEDSTVAIAPAVKPKQEDSESPPRPQPRKQVRSHKSTQTRNKPQFTVVRY